MRGRGEMRAEMAGASAFRVIAGDARAFKPSSEGVGKAAGRTEILGEVQHKVLATVVYVLKLRRFAPRDVHRALRAMGYSVSVFSICKALRRLVDRGIVVRVCRGYYELTDKAYEALDRFTVLSRPRYIAGPGKPGGPVKDDGAGGPRDLTAFHTVTAPLLEPGIYFDNVRGRDRFGRYINGDRSGFLRPIDLEILDGISYLEPRYATGTDLMRGLGVLVTYFSCGRVGLTGTLACSDVDEWRPPSGLVRELGVAGARRLYREVLLRGSIVRFVAVSEAAGPRAVARMLRGMARSDGRVAGFFEAVLGALIGLARMGIGWAVEMARGFALRVINELGL
ncbi:MAG: hypothetical protein QXU64_02115 [Thermofilaceae archaeon]